MGTNREGKKAGKSDNLPEEPTLLGRITGGRSGFVGEVDVSRAEPSQASKPKAQGCCHV